MKTLIATFSLSAALLAPAATLAATTPAAATARTATSNTVAHIATPAKSQDTTNAPHVAMKKLESDTSFGRQANDDRQGLSRIQELARQLGATN